MSRTNHARAGEWSGYMRQCKREWIQDKIDMHYRKRDRTELQEMRDQVIVRD